MSDGKKVLLAFGEGALNQAISKALQDADFQVSAWPTKGGHLPKERYDYLVQLAKDPTALTEGTRQLLEKAKSDQAEFLLVLSPPAKREATHLEAIHFAEALTREFRQKHGVKTVILRLPKVFGPGIPLSASGGSGTLGHLILEFIEGTVLTLYGEGEDEDYYLYLTDAAEAVKEALNLKEKEGETYFAAPSTPLSSAALAEALRRMGGGRHEVHYHKGLVPLEESAEWEGKALPHFKPKVSLEKGVLEILKAQPLDPAYGGARDKPGKGQKERLTLLHRLRLPSKKWGIRLIILLLIFSPLLYLGGRAFSATYHLLQLRQQIGALDFAAANRTAAALKTDLGALDQTFGLVPFLPRRTPLSDLQLISQGGTEAAAALSALLTEGETALTILENLLKSYQGEAIRAQAEEEFRRLTLAFKEAEDRLLAAWLSLDQTHPSIHRLIAPQLDLLQEGLTAVRLGSALSGEASDLLGYQGERSYLIFFQNSAEIWAGGGAATSIAHLTLENGGIKSLAFFDHWGFSHITGITEEKPEVFARLSGSTLRPPTYIMISPDFANNAKFFAKVFKQAEGVEVDGVIGIDLHFAEKLLEITGPFQLPDFENKEITAANLFEVAETEVEKEFFPGSSKKKRFMLALGEGVLAKLFAVKQGNYLPIARLLWEQLQEKGVLLYFSNPQVYQTAVEGGFAGLVKRESVDYLFPLDHNTGTKGTVWVKREIAYKVFNPDREGTMRAELTITWKNEGTSSWPAGKYRNIFRVLVPKESTLISAVLDEKNATTKIIRAEELGKGVLAIALEIEPQATKTLKLAYNLPFNLETLSKYQLLVQKQPGTIGDSFTFTFEEPFGKRISGEATPAIASSGVAGRGLQKEGNNLIFKGNLERDLSLEVVIEEGEAL